MTPLTLDGLNDDTCQQLLFACVDALDGILLLEAVRGLVCSIPPSSAATTRVLAIAAAATVACAVHAAVTADHCSLLIC